MSKRYEVYKKPDTTPFSSDTISSTSFQITFPSNSSTTTDDVYLIKYIDDDECEATMDEFKVLKRAPACTCNDFSASKNSVSFASGGGSDTVRFSKTGDCTGSLTDLTPSTSDSWITPTFNSSHDTLTIAVDTYSDYNTNRTGHTVVSYGGCDVVNIEVVQEKATPGACTCSDFSASTASVSFTSNGGSSDVTFGKKNGSSCTGSLSDLTFTSSDSWITTGYTASTGVLRVSASPNFDKCSGKTGSITVSYNGNPCNDLTITVEQSIVPCDCNAVSFSSTATIGADGGNSTFGDVATQGCGCQVSFVSSDDSWLTASVTSSGLTATATATQSQRTGTITVYVNGNSCGTCTITQSAPEPPASCRLALIQEPYPNPNKGIVDGNNITFTSSSINTCSSLSFYVESYGSTTAQTLMPQATITEGGEYISDVSVSQGFGDYIFYIGFKIAPDNNQHSGKIRVTNDCNSTGIEISITYKNNHEFEGTENGHDWVDLCLPSGTLWAKQNFGGGGSARYFTWANSDYYGAGYHDFTEANYRTSSGYNLTDNITQGGQYDMARNVMGGRWVLPTVAQYQELFNNCTCCFSSSADKLIMTSKRNGKQITFDADGCYCEGTSKRCGTDEHPDLCLFERLWVCDYDSASAPSSTSEHKCKAAQVEQRCKYPDVPDPCNLDAFTGIHSNQPVWFGMQIRGCFKK